MYSVSLLCGDRRENRLDKLVFVDLIFKEKVLFFCFFSMSVFKKLNISSSSKYQEEKAG